MPRGAFCWTTIWTRWAPRIVEARDAAFGELINRAAATPATLAQDAACKAVLGALLADRECTDQAQRIAEGLAADFAIWIRMNLAHEAVGISPAAFEEAQTQRVEIEGDGHGFWDEG